MLYSSKKHIGCNAYDDLLKHIDKIIRFKTQLDLRAFRTILEHSKTLTYINDYFTIPENYYKTLIDLNKKANYLFLLSIKYNLTQSENLIFKIRKYTLEYINDQKNILNKIYSYI